MMKVNWPDGKRIAIMLAFDIDAELMWMLRNDENDKHPANISRGHCWRRRMSTPPSSPPPGWRSGTRT